MFISFDDSLNTPYRSKDIKHGFFLAHANLISLVQTLKKDCTKESCDYNIPDLNTHLKNIESQVGTLSKIESKLGLMHQLQPKLKDLMQDINEITDFSSLREAKRGGQAIRDALDAQSKGKGAVDASIELKAVKDKLQNKLEEKESEVSSTKASKGLKDEASDESAPAESKVAAKSSKVSTAKSIAATEALGKVAQQAEQVAKTNKKAARDMIKAAKAAAAEATAE